MTADRENPSGNGGRRPTIWSEVLRLHLEGPALELVERAAAFAERAHEDQRREVTGAPYFTHPKRVAIATSLLPGATPEMVAAQFLHDTVEDGVATMDDIAREFGGVVADHVFWMTKPSKTPAGKGRPRAERERLDLEHYAKAPPAVKRMKMLDRIDNLGEMQGFPQERREAYAKKSLELAAAVGDADPALRARLIEAAQRLLPPGGARPGVAL